MKDGERRHHGYTTGGPEGTPAPEPTHAERARTLLAQAGEGSLATHSDRHPGFPFASLMPYVLDGAGRPIVLVSTLAVHTQNLRKDDRVSLLVAEAAAGGRNPLGLARVTLIGRMRDPVDGPGGSAAIGPPSTGEGAGGGASDDRPNHGSSGDEVRELYLARHPDARHWVDYPDFAFLRMEVQEVYYVGGFGVMGWVSAADYVRAEPDPLWTAAGAILEHMNADHADALVLLARSAGIPDVQHARMAAIDRLGYHLRVGTAAGPRGVRIGFPNEARNPGQVRELLVAQVAEARARLAAG